ncbi:MAG: efflux RND transporter periplasmic adaptor subunit [Ignavibacteria bacterium]|nr:efflux RND transporter periplasmic adaptor subunit [Ignavibacteria bacterium]
MLKAKKSIAVLFMIIVVTYIGCGKNENNKSNSTKTISDTVAVEVAKVELKDLQVNKIFSGTLKGEEQANIVSKIPERIVKINVKVGDYVREGQVLIILDKSGASSQYYQAEANYLNASRNLERMKALYEEGAISQQMLDGTQTQYNIAKANFDAAKSTVELATPITGVITAVNCDIGDLANPGNVLMTVASINRMKVIFNVGELDIPNFAVGQVAEIYSELKPELVQKGKISQISKSADVQSRSFEVQTLFNNTNDRWFKPGMFCKVRVNLKSKKGSLVVPNLALINDGNQTGIFVINNGVAEYRTIQTGLNDGTLTEVISGVKRGEQVVTLGQSNLKNGSLIYITNN